MLPKTLSFKEAFDLIPVKSAETSAAELPGGGAGHDIPPGQAVLQVAVASPLRRLFDYLPPRGVALEALQPGCRLQVPFGRSRRMGVLMAVTDHSPLPRRRLKPVSEVLDREPVVAADLLQLATWAAAYFQYPIGEAVLRTLPRPLRLGRAVAQEPVKGWCLTPEGKALHLAALKRAPRQRQLMTRLQQAEPLLTPAQLDKDGKDRRTLALLVAKGLAETASIKATAPAPGPAASPPLASGPQLNAAQARAVAEVTAWRAFGVFLLQGVTGSGKTEVYLRLIEDCLARGRQALVLVPEIGLTPQTVARFTARLQTRLAVFHSALTDTERQRAWQWARSGQAGVIIGTRSAVFAPVQRLGVIVIDEEHDGSYKQQQGLRYSARDLAVVRARQAGVAVLLGSATPSFESLHNSARGRYRRLSLPARAGGAVAPVFRVLDLRARPFQHGLSTELEAAIEACLGKGEQVLLFLNRRGFAPQLICYGCGWVGACERCDARLVYHREAQQLRCHHCGAAAPAPEHCSQCNEQRLNPLGIGTERLTRRLRERFPQARVVQVDRDTTRRKGQLQGTLSLINRGLADIVVGTRMLTKGHHFPGVTLVGVLDADVGLFSLDFRAGEQMAQELLQVAGRAGRGDRPGQVLIQTHNPGNPLLTALLTQGYTHFAQAALREREQAGLPPFGHLAVLRADAVERAHAQGFLEFAATKAGQPAGVSILGPVPAPMERRAGRHRWQLLLEAKSRRLLQEFLTPWLQHLEEAKPARKVRWSIDVDPLDLA